MQSASADNRHLRRYMTTARLVRAFGIGRMPTGKSMAEAELDARRRKLLFRAWHRGMRELDLVLGHFADRHMADLAPEELDQLERLMEVPDCDLLAWVLGQTHVHPEYDTQLWRRLCAFNFRQEQ
jgi:antitoxin CptB